MFNIGRIKKVAKTFGGTNSLDRYCGVKDVSVSNNDRVKCSCRARTNMNNVTKFVTDGTIVRGDIGFKGMRDVRDTASSCINNIMKHYCSTVIRGYCGAVPYGKGGCTCMKKVMKDCTKDDGLRSYCAVTNKRDSCGTNVVAPSPKDDLITDVGSYFCSGRVRHSTKKPNRKALAGSVVKRALGRTLKTRS